MPRPDYRDALAATGLPGLLAAWDARVVGTPPLGLDLPGSDIDIVACAPDPDALADMLWHRFSDRPGFALRRWIGGGRPLVAGFEAAGWPFEIFVSPEPVARQAGWRHFAIERRLLALGGAEIRDRIMGARHAGLKTEPAFAQVLGLTGDPYAALLDLETATDADLGQLLTPSLRPR